MTSVNNIFEYLCTLAPLSLQTDYDNAGFLLGHSQAPVSRVLLALDITGPVIQEAIDIRAQLIVSHHPLIWGGLTSVTDAGKGGKALRLAENGIAVISMHTNLDIAQGGVNDVLIKLLGAEPEETLDNAGCGRIGTLPASMPLSDFLRVCKDRLHTKGLRFCDAGREVKRLAVLGGAGGSELSFAYEKGCDTYVTADVKYNTFLDAKELGINLIDADHFCTENPVMPVLAEKLRSAFPSVEFTVSERHEQVVSFA